MFKSLLILFFVFAFTRVSNAFLFWNQACTFAGTASSYLAVDDSPTLDITGSFTIELWLCPSNALSPASQMILEKRNSSGTAGYTVFLSNGKIAVATNSVIRLTGNTAIQSNVWTHVAVTLDSVTHTFSIFLNGVADATAIVSNSDPQSNDDSIKIGKSTGMIGPYAGFIDEVRIWMTNLNSSDISKFRRTSLGTASGIYSMLVLSLTFQDNESSGTDFSLEDWSGNGNTAFNRSISNLDQSNRPSVTLSPNECIELNGTSDFLNAPDNADVSPTSAITLESWIFPRNVSGNKIIIHKGTATGAGINYSLRLNGNVLSAIINGALVMNSSLTINSLQWTHVAFTYSSSNGNYKFYVNGNNTGTGTLSQAGINNGTDNLFIGGNGTSGSYFNGFIDEVRISNYAKSNSDLCRFMFRSIDQANEPNSGMVNVVYNLDGYATDNADNGPLLNFNSTAAYSSPGTTDNQPVSPLNRADDLSFSNSFHLHTTGKRIPETGTIGVVADSMQINFDTLINDVNVFVGLNHSAEEEIDLYLIGPHGESVLLYANQTLVQNSDNIITIFNDQSDSSVINNSRYVSFAPKVKPRNSLNSVFSGKRTPGKWKLIVNDETGIGFGRLYCWGVQFNNMSEIVPGLGLRVFMEGFYRAVDSCVIDTIKVTLKESVSPYLGVGVKYETPDVGIVGNYNFPEAILGSYYYLEVNHRNSIEIWSAHPVSFDIFSGGLSYDFTLSADSAYGSNQIQVEDAPLRFAMYGGDVNQDSTVDLTDLSLIDNDAADFSVGYLPTDLTGDNSVDISDLAIADNNSSNFISVIVPP